MKEDIKISIVLPCYNVGKYLDSCLSSISSQTYKNWECIIINDGSPDNVSEIAHRWVSQDSRYVLYEKENGGVSQTRNYGIDKATGSYLYFLDPDDTLYDDKSLEHFYNAIKEYPYDIISGAMIFIPIEGDSYTDRVQEQSISLKRKGDALSFLFDYCNMDFWSVWSAGNKMYRLDFLREYQLLYSGREIGEDLLFNFKACFHAASYKFINEVTYSYIMREKSRMSSEKKEEELSHRLIEISEYCQSHNAPYFDGKEYSAFIRNIILGGLIRPHFTNVGLTGLISFIPKIKSLVDSVYKGIDYKIAKKQKMLLYISTLKIMIRFTIYKYFPFLLRFLEYLKKYLKKKGGGNKWRNS